MNMLLDGLVHALHVDALTFDQTKYVVCLLAMYPAAYFFRLLCRGLGSASRHAALIVLGAWLAHYVFGAAALHLLILSTACYALNAARVHPTYNTAFCITYTSACHLMRMHTQYLEWTVDITGPLMLMVIKCTFYAFDTWDLDCPTTQSTRGKALHDDIAANGLMATMGGARPTILQYSSFMVCPFNLLAGPVPRLGAYVRYVDGMPTSNIYSGLKPALGSLAQAGLFGAGTALSFHISLTDMPQAFDGWSFCHRAAYLLAAAFLVRQKYYFAWKLAEGANQLFGIARTENGTWDGACNVRPVAVELAASAKDVADNWNLCTNAWTRNYIYLRLPADWRAEARTVVTFLISGLWHGFYPGYLISFATGAWATILFRASYRKIGRQLAHLPAYARLYRIVATATCFYVVSTCSIAFGVLSASGTLRLYHSLYWSGHLLMLFWSVALALLPGARRSHCLRVALVADTAHLPTAASGCAAGFDLFAASGTTIPPGETRLVDTGIAIALPSKCMGRILPRSGLALKNRIFVNAGVVDEDYRGKVGVVLHNAGDTDFLVKVGDRIAQLVVVPIQPAYAMGIEATSLDNLGSTDRGIGGFGSTGK